MATIRDRRNEVESRMAESVAEYEAMRRSFIREHLQEIIANISLMSATGEQVFRVPIQAPPEPMFRFGDLAHEGAGQTRNAQRGQHFGNPAVSPVSGTGMGAGSMPGEAIFEEVSAQELDDMLLDELGLLDLEEKIAGSAKREHRWRIEGKQVKGIWPRLHRRATARRHLMRKVAGGTPLGRRLPYREEDLQFFRLGIKERPITNAVLILQKDSSRSMDGEKQFLVRALGTLIVRYVRRSYQDVQLVFITHDAIADETDEDHWFQKTASGGTKLSTAPERALQVIAERFPKELWNIYAVHFSDGENTVDDNSTLLVRFQELLELANVAAFVETQTGNSLSGSALKAKFDDLERKHRNFVFASVSGTEEIAPAVRKIIARDSDSRGNVP